MQPSIRDFFQYPTCGSWVDLGHTICLAAVACVSGLLGCAPVKDHAPPHGSSNFGIIADLHATLDLATY